MLCTPRAPCWKLSPCVVLSLHSLTGVLFVLCTLRTLCTWVFCNEKVTVPQDKNPYSEPSSSVRCTGPKLPLISECHRFSEKVTKVGFVLPMVVVCILSHAEFGNDYRKDAPFFILKTRWPFSKFVNLKKKLSLIWQDKVFYINHHYGRVYFLLQKVFEGGFIHVMVYAA